MTEGMDQYGNTSPTRSLEEAASEFRSRVEEAANRLSGAAEQFVTMSDALMAAVQEAKQAADRAQEAQRSIEELQQRMAHDYGSVSGLVRDLQDRIGALATLARPLAPPEEPQNHVQGQENHQETSQGWGGNPGEGSW